MTTIAYRDGIMVADSAVFDRDVYCGEVVKITRATDGTLYGAAGFLGDNIAFQDWVASGAQGEVPEFVHEDSEGIIVHPDGRIEWCGSKRRRTQIKASFAAIGSGFKLAMAVMHVGGSAEKAVEVAADLDAYTRRPLLVLRHVE